jgi:hypothetical protein|nr:MAG TPA: hypothetical protein [Caudoviricetes sp.]
MTIKKNDALYNLWTLVKYIGLMPEMIKFLPEELHEPIIKATKKAVKAAEVLTDYLDEQRESTDGSGE